ALYFSDKVCDLEARSDNGQLGDWKLGVRPKSGERQEINWILKNTATLSGTVASLDAKGISGVVVQALRSSGRESAPSNLSGDQSRLTSAATVEQAALTDDRGVFKFMN